MKNYPFLLLLVLLTGNFLWCGACKPSARRVKSYVAWVEDATNGLHQVMAIPGYELHVQYKPAAYLLIREKGMHPGDPDFQEMVHELSDFQYYTLRCRPDPGSAISSAASREDHRHVSPDLSRAGNFSARFDILLVCQRDTIPASFIHEEPHGVSGAQTLLFGFPQADPSTGRSVVILPRKSGEAAAVFPFSSSLFSHLPTIR